jgi:two-component system, CitB family, sensor kinase
MPRKMSLASRFLVFHLGIALSVVGAVAAVSVAESDATFRRETGARLRSVAENLAATSIVRQSLEDPRLRDALAAEAESRRSVSGASYVVIADARGTLLTGPSTGHPATLGASTALTGRSWHGVVDDGSKALVAHVPILRDDGGVIGLVIVGQTYPTLWQRLASATPNLLIYLLLGAVLAVGSALLLANRVKRQTLGLEPGEITGLVEHQEAMLHGIKEGVVGSDAADRVTLANDEAIRLLGLPPDVVGRSLHDLRMETRVLDVLTGRMAGSDQLVLRDARVLVLNRMPVVVRGRTVGSVTTLRDRTELTSLQRELDVSRHTTDTLRAQTHEFTNRLHTISGLVELGDYDEVVRYITRASLRHERLTSDVTSRVADPAVAALLIAKASLAAEQDVELRISPDCRLDPADESLATDLVTVLGNLIDNALDAIGPQGWVDVEVRQVRGEILVTVQDSGAGVPPDLAKEVFRQGYTTKSSGGHHGFGLALTRLVCVRRGGAIDVCGSAFTATVPVSVGAAL